ncbi:MAG: hypothetical protein AAGA66_04350 [Bacteroidota bacterium]
MYSQKLDGVIWKIIPSMMGDGLLLDVRNEKKKTVKYVKLPLDNHRLKKLSIKELSWWSNVEFYDGEKEVFISEYQDQKDPTNKKYFRLGKQKVEIELNEVPIQQVSLLHPFLYEEGTPYHQTVASFLGLQLPLSCEYLEHEDHIIMSYYLRSGNAFDRFLLILKNGEKQLKEVQDLNINGFAAGAFFMLEEKVFYVKNRNEICIYPL